MNSRGMKGDERGWKGIGFFSGASVSVFEGRN